MSSILDQLALFWQGRLQDDYPQMGHDDSQALVRWLIGRQTSQPKTEGQFLAGLMQRCHYRYRILRQYLGRTSTQAYGDLIHRLGTVIAKGSHVRFWLEHQPEHHDSLRQILHVLIQQMTENNKRLKPSIDWLTQCSQRVYLRRLFLLAEVEIFCLQPVHAQPLILVDLIQYLYHSRPLTPEVAGEFQDLLHVILEDTGIVLTELEGAQLLGWFAVNDGAGEAASSGEGDPSLDWDTQQHQRWELQQSLERDLAQSMGELAVNWLRLYLQGRPQSAIAQTLGLPVAHIKKLQTAVTERYCETLMHVASHC